MNDVTLDYAKQRLDDALDELARTIEDAKRALQEFREAKDTNVVGEKDV